MITSQVVDDVGFCTPVVLRVSRVAVVPCIPGYVNPRVHVHLP